MAVVGFDPLPTGHPRMSCECQNGQHVGCLIVKCGQISCLKGKCICTPWGLMQRILLLVQNMFLLLSLVGYWSRSSLEARVKARRMEVTVSDCGSDLTGIRQGRCGAVCFGWNNPVPPLVLSACPLSLGMDTLVHVWPRDHLYAAAALGSLTSSALLAEVAETILNTRAHLTWHLAVQWHSLVSYFMHGSRLLKPFCPRLH